MRFKVNSAKCFEGFGTEAINLYTGWHNELIEESKYYQNLLKEYNYELDDYITINTLEELIQLLKKVKCGLVLDDYSKDKEIIITIYDDYLE